MSLKFIKMVFMTFFERSLDKIKKKIVLTFNPSLLWNFQFLAFDVNRSDTQNFNRKREKTIVWKYFSLRVEKCFK